MRGPIWIAASTQTIDVLQESLQLKSNVVRAEIFVIYASSVQHH